MEQPHEVIVVAVTTQNNTKKMNAKSILIHK
jgi:hypothetical protein